MREERRPVANKRVLNIPFALSLGLVDIVAPDVDAMPADQDGVGIGVLLHGGLKVLGEVLLVGGVFDDGDPQSVVVAQVSGLGHAPAEALDLLDVVDLKDLVPAGALGLEQQGDEDGPLRVRVDAAAGVAAGEGCQEERRALRRLVAGGRAKVGPLPERGLLRLQGEDVDVGVFHELLLHARRGEVHEVTSNMLVVFQSYTQNKNCDISYSLSLSQRGEKREKKLTHHE